MFVRMLRVVRLSAKHSDDDCFRTAFSSIGSGIHEGKTDVTEVTCIGLYSIINLLYEHLKRMTIKYISFVAELS